MRADGTRSRSGKHTDSSTQRMGPNWATARTLVVHRDGTVCHWCGIDTIPATRPQAGHARDPRERTIDHLIARQHGGTNDLVNLVVSCLRCNSSKGKRHRPLTHAAARAAVIRSRTSRNWLD